MTHKIVTITLNPAIDLACSVTDLQHGHVNRVHAVQEDAGGKALNVSKVLAKFNVSSYATGFLGRHNDQIFQELFDNQILKDAFCYIEGSTRYAVKILEPENQITTDLNFPSLTPTQEEQQTFLDKIKPILHGATHVVLAGSVPSTVDQAFLETLHDLIRAENCLLYVDSSGAALRTLLEFEPDFAKPNKAELEEFLGRPLSTLDDVLQAGLELQKSAIKHLVISLGEEGALFFDENDVILAKPPNLKVISTVGAGDAMVTGCLLSDLQGKTLAEKARFATSLSLATLTTAAPSLHHADDIHPYLSQITLTVLHKKG